MLFARYSFHTDKYVMYPSFESFTVLNILPFNTNSEMNGIKSDKMRETKKNCMLLVFSSLSPCAILRFNSSCLHAMHGKDIRLNYGYIRGKKKRFTNKTLLVTDPVCWVCSCFFFSSISYTF